ncbi:carboxypeptidase-like regulatory domain-containing protein [Changchengzhania lutea]|uniref:carboxypeptidase-like regulatory domain-containing protein n=1 Tax=Changchengzhania lutea TaxID=2049305 RepID=UPI00163DC94C|nr:carboxypeptidase-like regulatory domain-containing protein [Changchengzhania lutea]
MDIPKHSFFLMLFALFSFSGNSQAITSTILEEYSKQPLESVSVYYDGTTIGTVTNQLGEFSLSNDIPTQAAIVISYLGYETRYFNQEQLKERNTIFLRESALSLDAVVLEVDPWSRKKKLNIFRREFLGREVSAKDCRILNEADIKLIYQPSYNRLIAHCENPIVIKNRYLGYELRYLLVDFEVQFARGTSGLRFTESVYLVGSTAFKELNDKPRKRHLKAREIEYLGSSLQFMRALTRKNLESKKFRCFINDTVAKSELFFPVNPYDYLLIKNDNAEFTKVNMNFKKLVVQYDQNRQSALIPQDGASEFKIDGFGIHSPPTAVLFSGDFGVKRIATLLPLDYELESP